MTDDQSTPSEARKTSGLTPPTPGNYAASALNQYTSTPWDSVQTPSHDADGKLLQGPVPGGQGAYSTDGTAAASNLVWDARRGRHAMPGMSSQTGLHYHGHRHLCPQIIIIMFMLLGCMFAQGSVGLYVYVQRQGQPFHPS